ncbi:Maltose permease MAL31 [Tolypocladium ophioglossoides CBS 100239]|uniref:Maltose permease MAL31 n=1 Tax=Tolypocladium ophioglossoides (strain CBS 100239) TaxID=1163406 RepID=A0A0L0N1N7_TOLOC|nr:Maltose permease MAL31 [Tolypocladium ophioglossoides CBS 100239]
MVVSIADFTTIMHDAALATAYGRNMTFPQAIHVYPKPALFSMALSLSLVMEGYDTALLGSFFGFPAFQRRFGEPVGDGTYQLTATWQPGLQAAVQVGEIVGLWIAGHVAERYGYRRTMLGADLFMVGAIFIMFFAQNIGMLLAGEFLCGLPWGAFQTLTATYATEISPMPLRPYLTTYCNMCWVMGQLISAGVVTGLINRTDDWGWRIPYATQWFWPMPIIIGILFAPESPWWLVRKDRIEDAKRTLRKMVSSKYMAYDVDRNVAMMIHTNALEKAVSAGTSYKDLFTGVDLRRTEIACCVWLIQVTCGTWFGGNVLYFLEQAGFSTQQAFNFNLGHNAIALLGTLCAWWAMDHTAHRRIHGHPGAGRGRCVRLGDAADDLHVRLRRHRRPRVPLRGDGDTIDAAAHQDGGHGAQRVQRAVHRGQLPQQPDPEPNPTAWNLRGKGGFVWALFALASLVWAYFRLPEPKGRSAGEMDVPFEQRVSARHWRRVQVDEFRSGELKGVLGEDVVEVEMREKI